VAIWPPLAGVVVSVAVTVYPEMAEPSPLVAGAVKDTAEEAGPAVADAPVGAEGAPSSSVTCPAALVPMALVAVTEKV